MTSVLLIGSLGWIDLFGFMEKNAIGCSGSASDHGHGFDGDGGSSRREYGLSPMLKVDD